jgi:hypothetical protein
VSRPKGAPNIVLFVDRARIETSSSKEIKHLANTSSNPLEEFKNLLRHQKNFLDWIDDRHTKLQNKEKELAEIKGMGGKGPKDATYRKYRWYAEQLTLLEAINNFEVFYKQTLIGLASTLQEFVPPSNIKGSVDGKVLWSTTGSVNVASLLLEHQLFHDLDNVDKVTSMLLGKRRYNINSPHQHLKETVKAIQAIFQVRHTLSHNGGLVTGSDSTKFKVCGYQVPEEEVIDPTKEKLGYSILTLLKSEADNFTDWARKETISYLVSETKQRNLEIPHTKRDDFQQLLGGGKEWDKVPWS